jgi:ubiquitin carboxyl-terminal hydrolase 25/28
VRHSYPDKSLEELNELQNTFIVHFEHKPRDIYEGLDVALGLEPVTLNGGKIANRYSTATHLAPFLQIYFQKLEFNKTTLESSVIKHHVHLEDTLYMDRYMPNASPELLQLRQLSWELRDQRKKFKQELEEFGASKTGLNGPETLDTTWQFINDFGEELDETSALKENLKAETERRREALEAVEKGIEDVEAKLYSIPFDKFDTPENSYKLFAVFVHRGPGGSRGGHYWIYIHDSTNDVWRRYEDREVRQVTDLDEIFAARDPETQGAPNFVVYVRDDLKAEMIDALNRVQPESTSPADVEMTDLEVAGEFKMIDGVDPSMLYHG